jgi:hypothetical protein
MKHCICLLMLISALDVSYAQPKNFPLIRPADVQQKAFSGVNIQNFAGARGLARALADREPVDIMSNLASADLKFSTEVRAAPLAANWEEALCNSLEQLNLPMGWKHQPIFIIEMSGPMARTYEAILERLRCFRARESALVYPIGVISSVFLTSGKDVFPPWISIEHLTVGALASLPEGENGTWTRDPRRFMGRKCVLIDPQPPDNNKQATLDKLGRAACVERDSSSRILVGEWTEKWISLYRKENGTAPERNMSSLSYSVYEEKQNATKNWATIDSGIRESEISIRLLGKTADGKRIARELCQGTEFFSRLRMQDWRLAKVFLERSCDLRREITRIDEPDLTNRNQIYVAALPEYLDRLRTEHRYANLYPVVLQSNVTPTSAGEARRQYIDALKAGYNPLGSSVWLIMDPRALAHPNVARFVEELRSGPAKRSYRGEITFFSDL